MREGLCYAYNSSTSIYAYPNLTCIDGSPVPTAQNTVRQIWTYDEVRDEYIFSSQSNANVNYNSGTSVIAHVYSEPAWYTLVSPNYLFLGALFFVFCFFKLILNMFMGVRR